MPQTVTITKEQAQAVADALCAQEQAHQHVQHLVSVLSLGHVAIGTPFAGVDTDAGTLLFADPEPVADAA